MQISPSAELDRALRRLLRLIASSHKEGGTFRRAGDEAAVAVLDRVADWLYQSWYCLPDPEPSPTPAELGRSNLVSALRASLPASSRWDEGWVVMKSAQNGACVAGRRGETRELGLGDYVNVSRLGVPPMPGDAVAVTERIDVVDERAGFWGTRSRAGEPVSPLVRLYWSVDHDQIGYVLRAVATALDELKIRYALKCPVHASAYARVDSLIVYLERPACSGALPAVISLARTLRGRLRLSCPPLTLAIAEGVAFAEDPGASESFGQHRCRALAPGVLALLDGAFSSDADGIVSLKAALRAAGINPEQPWLNGSA